ncbi:nucleotidyltransferase domain-containing protein [Sphingosinicella rhizophila]|uniref:Nucleotidyltransferase family protein n=1 Tax=Sphingosinicella rhizophila TaxID=3050082 RepID=A0ABU3QAQ4_9SPHN|nr:nucleotidyltransferase family protein [Sphingosinicella sp. GR2756]MDT9600473.1 nucleotidyltransferase family protein [Sphingosinicella sp. GR2756]
MLKTGSHGRLWPNRDQELLLKAAIGTGDDAVAAYRAWRDRTDFAGHVDEGTFNLIPLLYANMARLGVQDRVMPRLKGVYRNSWVRSAQRASVAAELLGLLHQAGIKVMVSKGLPLALAFYDGPAARPMNDFDLVVPKSKAAEASRLLQGRGFRAARHAWNQELAIRHAVSHIHPSRGEVDLHWHILFECLSEEADRHFWDHAVPLDVSGVPVLRPSATDLLLHVLIHGMRWNMAPPMRWVADAAMILRGSEAVDWDRMIAFAARYRLTQRLSLALTYLKERFEIPVPDPVVAAIAGGSSLVEKFEIFAMQGEDERSGFRHLRRAAHLLRLATSEERAGLSRALGHEILKRYGPTGFAARRARNARLAVTD